MYDALVIGGGFFGCCVANYLKSFLPRILVVERETDLLQRASYNNQARVHQGYHYPRSLLTALRSRVNFDRFAKDYPETIVRSFTKYYAVGRMFSHVTATQYRIFCERIGAPIEPAPAEVKALFNFDRIEDVFLAQEWAFDAVKLKEHLALDLVVAGVDLALRTKALCISAAPGEALDVQLSGPEGLRSVRAHKVLNCTYSGINELLGASKLPTIPLKHEITEMALVEPPAALKGLGVTVMCGPFFSIMPFPPRGLHTLSHVRYTPHCSWQERTEAMQQPEGRCPELPSNFDRMVRDTQRYMPCMAECRYAGSLWEVKTVLPASEIDDSRPILFRSDHGFKNLICLMGGKIDNIYDVLDELRELRANGGFA